MAKFINPFTDFGFKLIFGTEKSKPFLIHFLNSVLKDEPGYELIVDIEYKDKESYEGFMSSRCVIYDILCTTDKGHHFVVEMQNGRQTFFLERAIFYMSRAITRQGEKGDKWKFGIKPVYVIALLNFTLPVFGDQLRTDVGLCDLVRKEIVSDKMRLIFIQLPNFKISVPDDCADNFDRWIYTLTNMEHIDEIPFAKEDVIFSELEKQIEYANMSEQERDVYDHNLKVYRDLSNTIDYALEEGYGKGIAKGLEDGRAEGRAEGREEGRAEGRAEGREEGREEAKLDMARSLKHDGMPIENIMKYTGLSEAQIKEL